MKMLFLNILLLPVVCFSQARDFREPNGKSDLKKETSYAEHSQDKGFDKPFKPKPSLNGPLSNQGHLKNVIVLEVGEAYKIKSPRHEKAWLSDGTIVSLTDSGSALLLQAKKKGSSLLNLGSRLYRIYVLHTSDKQNLLDIMHFLLPRMGLSAHWIDGKISIKGHLYRLKDWLDLAKKAKAKNLNYLFHVEVNEKVKTEFINYWNTHINKHPLAPLSIQWGKPPVFVIPKGSPLKHYYHDSLQFFGLSIKEDASLLARPDLIKLKVLLVESSEDFALRTGLDWGGGELVSLLDVERFTTMLKNFKAMETKGEADILSEVNLLTESGKTSHFLSGGEVPVPQYHHETGAESIKWKPYGIQLNITARSDRKQRIKLNTLVEMSDLDHSHSSQARASIKTNKIRSHVTLQSGQTLVLTTVLRKLGGKSFSAPFIFSRIPFAGKALSFKGNTHGKSRLNIFVTAHIQPGVFK